MKRDSHISTQYICVTAIGIALFAGLSLCLQVPVFENYYLCLGYVVMTVWCYSFGTLSGTIVGSLGVVLYCLLTSGMRGMPGWAIGNIVIGIGLGLTFSRTKTIKNALLRIAVQAVAAVALTALGILVVKSLIDSWIRAQPVSVRITMNMTAFIADAVMLIISLPICAALDPTARKLLPGAVK